MKITFACPQCAKPLVADSAFAGRTGRCRHCGHRAVIPAGPGAARPQTDEAGGYSLRPVTPVSVPKLAASDWDNAELGPAIAAPPSVFTIPGTVGPKRSSVAPSPTRAAPRSTAAIPSSGDAIGPLKDVVAALTGIFSPRASLQPPNGGAPLVVAYRSFFGLLGRFTAWVSETSYTLSFVLIILAVASGMTGRHSLAATAFWAIVALNLVGLAGDVTSLVTLSFRKNPLQGGLFLVPPFTLYYLWTDWYRYRDTIVRMRIPLTTLALVAVAYVLVPWLHGGSPRESRIVAAVNRAVETAEQAVAGRKGALDEGLKNARSWLREVPLPDPSSLPTGFPGGQSPAHDAHPPATGKKH